MNNDYWIKRERDQTYRKQLFSLDNALRKEYLRSLKNTKQDLLDLYDEIITASNDGTLLASDLYRYNRYYQMMNQLNQEMTRLGGEEIKITEQKLLDMYNITAAQVGNSLNFAIGVNADTAKKAVESIWCADGKHWSSRIWTNKKALQERIQNGLIDCISRGVSKNELVKQLQKDMGVGFNQADRLARTELTYIQNRATLDRFSEAGVQKYIYLSAHDDRTSEKCLGMNGKEFLLKDAKPGINFPPLHPYCRCTILADV